MYVIPCPQKLRPHDQADGQSAFFESESPLTQAFSATSTLLFSPYPQASVPKGLAHSSQNNGGIPLSVPKWESGPNRSPLFQFPISIFHFPLQAISPRLARSRILSEARNASASIVIVGCPRPDVTKLPPSQRNKFFTSCVR